MYASSSLAMCVGLVDNEDTTSDKVDMRWPFISLALAQTSGIP